MKYLLFCFLFLITQSAWSQYYPRGTSFNDNYLPNLDEPDKWIVALDGMFDWQKESTDTGQVSYQATHANFNLFYGGQKFRGGVQVLHDFNRSVKDLSVGLGFAFNRPLFLELGAGFLNRVANNTSSEGWAFNAKAGYYYNWIMHIQYRVRIRLALNYSYKTLNDLGNSKVTNFYPFIGFEFET